MDPNACPVTDTTPTRNRRTWTVVREADTHVGRVVLRRSTDHFVAPGRFQVTLYQRSTGTQVVCDGTPETCRAYFQGFTDAAALAAPETTPNTPQEA